VIQPATDLVDALLQDEGAPADTVTQRQARAPRRPAGAAAARDAALARLLSALQPAGALGNRRGFAEAMRALFSERADLEAAVVAAVAATAERSAIETVFEDWRAGLAAIPNGDVARLMRLDERLHHDLAALAGGGARAEHLRWIDGRTVLIRFLALSAPSARQTIAREHEQLGLALLAGDAATAERIARTHVARGVDDAIDTVTRTCGLPKASCEVAAPRTTPRSHAQDHASRRERH